MRSVCIVLVLGSFLALLLAEDARAHKCENDTWDVELLTFEGSGAEPDALDAEGARWATTGFIQTNYFVGGDIAFRMDRVR